MAAKNRLQHESSPYLRQHEDNPVDWHPWGADARERAAREDKPLLISIGYASCHWCHVMAHESFEDPRTAELMNDAFVNVKIDREERPDVDAVYMAAVQAMTGSGGWPLTVVATPEGEPFFGGTYFPPDERHGRPSFRRVLQALADAWANRRREVLESAASMRQHLGRLERLGGEREALGEGLFEQALAALAHQADPVHGGFGGAPKFPPHATLRFLLRRDEPEARQMAELALDRMAQGGIYDQVGGGFARYAVDGSWTVPHFEKMLYDNAQLVSRYAVAYARWGTDADRRVVEETVAWADRELLLPGGGYASSLDADSEGEEGRFYVWTAAAFDAALGADAPLGRAWFGVTASGNFEGRNVLTARADPAEVQERFGLDEEELADRVARLRERLLEVRAERVRPALDDKILTSWNGLMVGALADAGRFLDRPDMVDRAGGVADFVRDRLADGSRLWHVYGTDAQGQGRAKVQGILEDYAYLGLGLLQLYRATFEPRWLTWALDLSEAVMTHFHDADGGGFYTTPDDGEGLLVRPKEPHDAATPGASAAAAELVARCAHLTGRDDLREAAAQATEPFVAGMRGQPTGFGTLLVVADLLASPPREVAIVGPRRDAATRALLAELRRPLPRVLLAQAEGRGDPLAERVPVLRDRTPVEGVPAAYVCEGGACRLPTTEPAELARQLAHPPGARPDARDGGKQDPAPG